MNATYGDLDDSLMFGGRMRNALLQTQNAAAVSDGRLGADYGNQTDYAPPPSAPPAPPPQQAAPTTDASQGSGTAAPAEPGPTTDLTGLPSAQMRPLPAPIQQTGAGQLGSAVLNNMQNRLRTYGNGTTGAPAPGNPQAF